MMRALWALVGGLLVAMSFRAAVADNPTVTDIAVSPDVTVGESLPTLESTDDSGQPWKSADHVGNKVLVLYFYPGDFTGSCTRQAQLYRDVLAKLETLGVEVIGISGDEVTTHQLFKKTFDLKHTLLADPKGELAILLGVPVKAGGQVRATGPDRRPIIDAHGQRIELQRAVTLGRTTLVIGRDGKIISQRNNASPVTDSEEVLKIVQSLMQ